MSMRQAKARGRATAGAAEGAPGFVAICIDGKPCRTCRKRAHGDRSTFSVRSPCRRGRGGYTSKVLPSGKSRGGGSALSSLGPITAVQIAGARHQPGGATARSPPSGGGRSRPAKARIGGETQVVVGAELDHPPALHDHLRPLGARERDGVPAQALALQPGELPGAPCQGISHNRSPHRWRPG